MFSRISKRGIFTSPNLQGSLVIPGSIGGLIGAARRWDPVAEKAFSPFADSHTIRTLTLHLNGLEKLLTLYRA